MKLFLSLALAAAAFAQPPSISFDVASVKANRDANPVVHTNFPLGPGTVYVKGGLFSATGFPLISYILFAYKVTDAGSVISQLPSWVMTDRFDIQAKTDGDPAKDTKDQMRLMMRSLLAERFGLVTRYETRQVPVFSLVLDKPGKTGPLLRPHPADAVCTAVYSPGGAPPGTEQAKSVDAGFPSQCGGFLSMEPSVPGRMRIGARNVTMDFAASALTGLAGDSPLVDGTGLTGMFDLALEFNPPTDQNPDGLNASDPTGLTFQQALKEQLGLKLESTKGPQQFLVIDRIGHLVEN